MKTHKSLSQCCVKEGIGIIDSGPELNRHTKTRPWVWKIQNKSLGLSLIAKGNNVFASFFPPFAFNLTSVLFVHSSSKPLKFRAWEWVSICSKKRKTVSERHLFEIKTPVRSNVCSKRFQSFHDNSCRPITFTGAKTECLSNRLIVKSLS